MHRHAGRLAHGHEARDDRIRIAVAQRDHFAVHVAGNSSHVVVHGRQHRDRFARDVDAREDSCRLGNSRQALLDDGSAKVFQVQVDVVLVRTDAPALADLDRHRTTDDVA